MTEDDNPIRTFAEAAEQFDQQPPIEYVDANNERDYPAPAGHAPRLTFRSEGDRLSLAEHNTTTAWIEAENAWSVER